MSSNRDRVDNDDGGGGESDVDNDGEEARKVKGRESGWDAQSGVHWGFSSVQFSSVQFSSVLCAGITAGSATVALDEESRRCLANASVRVGFIGHASIVHVTDLMTILEKIRAQHCRNDWSMFRDLARKIAAGPRSLGG